MWAVCDSCGVSSVGFIVVFNDIEKPVCASCGVFYCEN